MKTLKVISSGHGASIQDFGRAGWRRFGVPPSGAMDRDAAFWANCLLGNDPDAAVVELLLQGARFLVMHDTWLAITGANACSTQPVWQASRLAAGTIIDFPRSQKGVWTYLAVPGGFDAPRWMNSTSAFPRGHLGDLLKAGDILSAKRKLTISTKVVLRSVSEHHIPNYAEQPQLRFWPGPQWEDFSSADRQRFTDSIWSISARSDRVGYRLEGPQLSSFAAQIISEPVIVGSVQIPPFGQPIVTMRDGPTVGGYPKIGLLEAASISRLAQCRPGTKASFKLIA